MDLEIRTYGDEHIPLCPHITICGRKAADKAEGAEYIQTLNLQCEVCKEEHSLDILVN